MNMDRLLPLWAKVRQLCTFTADKLRTNYSKLYLEWVTFLAATKGTNRRLRNGNWDYKDREHFYPHVLKAYVSDFTAMRRVMAELIVVATFIALLVWVL